MVHPEEILQVFKLRSGADLFQPLELCQVVTPLLPFLLLQGSLRQETAQATVHAVAHGRQRQYLDSRHATSTADATASTDPTAVPTPGGRSPTAPRLGHLGVDDRTKYKNMTEP